MPMSTTARLPPPFFTSVHQYWRIARTAGRGVRSDMLTEQQRRELDWKTDGLPAIVQHAASRSIDAGLYEPQALDKNHWNPPCHVLLTHENSGGPKAKPQAMCRMSSHVAIAITTLLVLAVPCRADLPQRRTSSCFGDAGHQWLFLYQLEQLLAERKTADPASSYTRNQRQRH